MKFCSILLFFLSLVSIGLAQFGHRFGRGFIGNGGLGYSEDGRTVGNAYGVRGAGLRRMLRPFPDIDYF